VDTLLIPGRPQAKRETMVGRQWRRDTHNLALAKLSQLGALPLIPEAFVRLEVDLIYSLPDGAPPELSTMPRHWADYNVPHGDSAAHLLATALAGILYNSPGQIQPLIVTRYVIPPRQLEDQYGRECRRGLTLVRYA
jgi:hypothetical protein